MKFEYEFEEPIKGVLFMSIKSNEFIFGETERIGLWLSTDVTSSGIEILKIIDKTINGEADGLYWSGNVDTAVFHKDTTTISYDLEEDRYEPCTLPTEMLREIVEIWTKEYDRFYGEKRNRK